MTFNLLGIYSESTALQHQSVKSCSVLAIHSKHYTNEDQQNLKKSEEQPFWETMASGPGPYRGASQSRVGLENDIR